jgi:hypothetical protein
MKNTATKSTAAPKPKAKATVKPETVPTPLIKSGGSSASSTSASSGSSGKTGSRTVVVTCELFCSVFTEQEFE